MSLASPALAEDDTGGLRALTLGAIVYARAHTTAPVFVRLRGLAVVAIATALILAPKTSAFSANPREPRSTVTGSTQSHTLVAYKMYGLGSTRLTVSTDAQAKVTSGGGHVTRFHLNAALWKRLKAMLKRTGLHVFAGGRCPHRPYPDAFIYVITVSQDTVCTTEGRIPHKLEPLMKILAEIVSAGERRIGKTS